MFGATTGSLTATVNGDTVWTLSGDQGDQWNIAQVDLAAYAGGDVVIGLYAAYGGSFTGDIGIDNIGLGELQLLGCTDASACNYDASATSDDGSCDYSCLGCTDSLANNYDPTSTIDDGSCVYCTGNWVTVSCDGGSFQGEVSWTLLASDGSVVATGGAPYTADLCLPDDCYTVDMVDSWGDGWNGNVLSISMSGATIGTATLASGSAGTADISVGTLCPVLGCTDATATNYDPAANTDDGSCQYSCTAAPYLETFDVSVGTVVNNGFTLTNYGTPSTGTGPSDDVTGGGNYLYYETSGQVAGAPAVTLTTECFDVCGLTSPAFSFYYHMFGSSIGTLSAIANGDTVWTMSGDQGDVWNWAQVDLSSITPCDDITFELVATYGGSFTGDIAIDNIAVDEFVTVTGCTDPLALNYDPSANTDDGSCTYCTGTMVTLNMYDSFGDGWNGATFTATGTTTGTVFGPYTLASGSTGTQMICMDDDCYEISVGGGSWDSEITWDITDGAGAVLVSGAAPYYDQGALGLNVICPVYGCTDSTALNFDTLATADDGSCSYLCDPYVASASVDNGPSCTGAFDASATATVAGSFGNDFWLWDNGSTSSTVTGLGAGTYSVTITDSVNGCVSVATVTIDPTPSIAISGTTFDATPGNTNGGVDLTVSGGTPCYNGASGSAAGVGNTTTQWAGNLFDVVASSDLQITSIDMPTMNGIGTLDVYYRLGSGEGYELDPSAWTLAGSAQVLANLVGDLTNVPVAISMNAGDTVSLYAVGVGVNVVFGAGVNPSYTTVVSSDANISMLGGVASGGAPGAGTTDPLISSYDFGGNVNYSLSSYTYAWSSGDSTEDVSGLGLGPISVTVTDCNGCTESWTGFILTNYVYGCMDTLASNYDAAANTPDSSCLYDGCTDPVATNYDATANNDDGSCVYPCSYYGYDDDLTVTLTPDWFTSEISWYLLDQNLDTVLSSPTYANGGAIDVQSVCVMNGCYFVHGYDSFGDGWGGGTLDVVDNAGNVVASLSLSASTFDSQLFSVGGANCTAGCTDSTAANFDPNVTVDDGSCADTIVGCTDPTAANYTPFSNVDDGSCVYCNDTYATITVGGGAWQEKLVGQFLMLQVILFFKEVLHIVQIFV